MAKPKYIAASLRDIALHIEAMRDLALAEHRQLSTRAFVAKVSALAQAQAFDKVAQLLRSYAIEPPKELPNDTV